MKKDKFITDFDDIPTPRQRMPHLPLEERKLNFKEVELGFTEELALRETSRCLSCRRCIGCGLCLAECDFRAIDYDQKEQYLTLSVNAVVVAGGIEPFDARKKPEFGYAYYPNVITNIEFERILNANGPFAGIIMRPSDGEIPERLAFIQCVGSRDEGLGANYCSNICCLTTLKQAIQAIDRVKNIEVTIYYRDLRPFTYEGELFYRKAKDEYGIKFIPAQVERLEEDPQTDRITVHYRQHEKNLAAPHDLVVLASGITTSTELKRLSRQIGARLNKYGFFPNSIATPVATAQEGVWLAGSITRPTDLSSSLAQASAVAARVMQSFSQQGLSFDHIAPPEASSTDQQFQDGTAIFFCRYGIESQFAVDADSLIKSINLSPKDMVISDLEYACNTTGKRKIVESLNLHRPRKIVIAPCYSSTNHLAMFQRLIAPFGYNADQLSIFNIELNKTADTETIKQRLMEIVEVSVPQSIPVGHELPVIPHAAVLGDSLVALQSALDIADQGFEVSLLAFNSQLGKNDQKIFWFVPELDQMLNDLMIRTQQHPRIKIYHHCQLQSWKKIEANHRIEFIADYQQQSLDVGAIVIAPSAQAYQPVEFHYGQQGNVFTQAELAKRLEDQSFSFQKIAMIQCIGSRRPDRPYCSQLCCQSAILNALKLKNKDPKIDIVILHRDIRVYDFEEDNYAEAIEKGVQFIRMEHEPLIEMDHGEFRVTVIDDLSKQQLLFHADCLVLSNGIIAPEENKLFATKLSLPIGADGFLGDNENVIAKDLSDSSGIFIAGFAHSPQRLEDALIRATAIAGKVGLLFRNVDAQF
ncbi:MAG: hypothetical protein ONB13_04380 [candidate division KSB1 bacterium]|nr:hypothetical protein [candidate division KSB1 bacterium]